ncbi:MAG: hypothetical protein AAFQ52_10230 [Chloroflexota bacterium]
MHKYITLLILIALLTLTTHAQNESSDLVGVRNGALLLVDIDTGTETILNEAEDNIEFYPFDSNSNGDVLVLALRGFSEGESRIYDGETGAMRLLTDNLIADCPPHFIGDNLVAYVSAEVIETYETENGFPGTINPVVLHDIETNSITHIQNMRIPMALGGGGGSDYAMAMVVDMDYYNPNTYLGDPRFFRVLEDNTVLAGASQCLGTIQRIDEESFLSLNVDTLSALSPDFTDLVSLRRFETQPAIYFTNTGTGNSFAYPIDNIVQESRILAVHWAQDDNAYFNSWDITNTAYTLSEDEQATLASNEFTNWDWSISHNVTLYAIQPDNGAINPVTTFNNAFQITRIDSDASSLYVSVVPDGTPVIEALRAGELVANSLDDLYSYLYPDIYRIPFGSNQPELISPRLQRFIVVE